MKDYLQQDKDIMRFFDYQPLLDFKNRLQDVYKRTYKRKELSHALYEMNQTWGAEEQALHNIERLQDEQDRKSTRLNSSHVAISYAVFCLKKKRNVRYKC